MRKGRLTDEQMVAILRKADRGPVAAVAKKHGVGDRKPRSSSSIAMVLSGRSLRAPGKR
jgi:hypothetical protein